MSRNEVLVQFKGDNANLKRSAKEAQDGLEGVKKTSGETDKSVSTLGEKFASFGGKAQAAGATLSKTLTPAALAVGAVMFKAGQDWKSGTNAIITGTGASGDALKDMQGTMKGLAGQVPQNMGDIGAAIAEVNTRLGLTGKPLEDMSKKMLDLSRITGTDVTQNVANMTRVFGDWGVEAKDQSRTMDMLFGASQATGIGVDTLSQKMVQFGAPLRSMGFDLETTTALLGKWEKEGVNTEKILGSLSLAANNFAKEGIPMEEGLKRTIEQIKGAKDSSEALAIAQGVVGSRAANDFQAAVREGRFELGDLTQVMAESGGSIDDAANRTLTLTDRIGMFKDGVMASLGPFGEMGALAAGGLAALGPALMGVGAVIPMLANPVFLMFAGIALLIAGAAFLIIKNWDKVKPVLDKVFDKFKPILDTVMGVIRDVLLPAFQDLAKTLSKQVRPIINTLVKLFKQVWGAIQPLIPVLKIVGAIIGLVIVGAVLAFIQALKFVLPIVNIILHVVSFVFRAIGFVIEALVNIVTAVFNTIYNIISFVMQPIIAIFKVWFSVVSTIIGAVFSVVRSVFNRIWGVIRGVINLVVGYFRFMFNIYSTIFNTILNIARNIFGRVGAVINGVVQTVKNVWNGIVSWFSGLLDRVRNTFSIAVARIRGLFTGIGGAIRDAFKGAFNFVVRAWNNTVGSINFKAPDWVPGLGGKGFSVPKLSEFNRGGFVSGAGSAMSDSIPAMLSNGEYVLRASAVRNIGVDNLNILNNGGTVGSNAPIVGVQNVYEGTDPMALAQQLGALVRFS
jgi:phage-related minor tail protein